MKSMPPKNHPIWKSIVDGKEVIDFTFIAANILMMNIRSRIGQNSSADDIERYADELWELFSQNATLPDVRKDIERITGAADSLTVMHSLDNVRDMILKGERLLLAGDENLLSKLPKGNWIGGTTPHFVAKRGGMFSKELIFVTKIPEYCGNTNIKMYDENNLVNVYNDAPENGFSLIIMPAGSKTHLSFALNARTYKNFAVRPLAGWVSSIYLDDPIKTVPKIYNGPKLEASSDGAIVMHVPLPQDRYATVKIFNIFDQGSGAELEFPETGFEAGDILINGEQKNYAEYITENKLDIKYPLIADYYGVKTNVSFKEIDSKNKKVRFFAPVFKGLKYKHSKPAGDYAKNFISLAPKIQNADVVFCCHCFLNYLYSGLEGKKTGDFTGPVTFGEIAYQLLNQTTVYLKVKKLSDE